VIHLHDTEVLRLTKHAASPRGRRIGVSGPVERVEQTQRSGQRYVTGDQRIRAVVTHRRSGGAHVGQPGEECLTSCATSAGSRAYSPASCSTIPPTVLARAQLDDVGAGGVEDQSPLGYSSM
jgi:hypothetical protein